MQVFRQGDRGYDRLLKRLNRRPKPDPSIQKVVSQILESVAADGDAALLRLTEKFGGPRLDTAQLTVTPQELALARASLPHEVRKAILSAKANVRAFARRSLRKSWFMKNKEGAIVGE